MKGTTEIEPADVLAEAAALAELNRLSAALDWQPLIPDLEAELYLRAACLHWTGDPLKQPPTSVLAALKTVLARKEEANAN